MSSPKLFTPIQVGNMNLEHRIVLAPLTRLRATKDHIHGKLAVDYYSQRGSSPGSLLITEATVIAPQAGGFYHVPGIYTDVQIAAWKDVVDAVHAKGSYIFLQLWALGRAADPNVLKEEGPYPLVSASDIPLAGKPDTPRPLTIKEIKEYVRLYAVAASNAVHGAGFDGVEIHGASGYLVDQFMQDVSNKRTDEYGGSVENRARFALEIVDAIAEVVGEKKVAIKFSPWNHFQDMRMEDPIPTFRYIVQQLVEKHPNLAYIQVVEPRVNGNVDRDVEEGETNDFIRNIWSPRPLISTGGYNRELALEVAENNGGLIAFGRHYIPNPDLVQRLKKNLPLAQYDRSKFYIPGKAIGYTDYPPATVQER
ncbi:FMN-linked oxidoreductase [Cytidiella melzeri]|nr:FMN-linked oxidoreductase [Cytidiella melzeri]